MFVDIELENHPWCMHDYIEVSTPSMHSLTASALNYIVIPPLLHTHVYSFIFRDFYAMPIWGCTHESLWEGTAKYLVFLYCNGLLMWRVLHISVFSSSHTFQFLPTDYCEKQFISVQLIFYCWLQVCSRGDLTLEWLDTSVLMTSVYCCRCMMGWTHLPEKLVATALPLHWL